MPTDLAFGADGNALVTLFSGFPFPEGGVKVAPDGGVYAVQLGEAGGESILPNSGAILRLREGRAEVVVGGLGSPSAPSFNEAGDGYVTCSGTARRRGRSSATRS